MRCRGCSRIDYLPALHRIGVCSRPVLPSLFARRIPTRLPLLYLSLRTYSVFPSPRPIYLPPRVAEWILFVSHRYFSGPACRSPSKTVSPPRFMFPPTQRRIDPFLLRMYTCAAAPPPLFPSQPPPFRSPHARAQISRTRLAVPARHAVDGLPSPLASPSSETSFQRFCHPPPPLFALFFL